MGSSTSKRRHHKQHQLPRGELPMERLKQKLAEGPTRGMNVVEEPKGQAKMSAVLEEFVEPYLEFVETEEDQRKLFTLAALAWNAALLPEDKREKMIDDVLGAGIPADKGSLRTDLEQIVRQLVARKLALFGDNTRAIVNFEVTETAEGMHLSVTSTL